MVTVVLALALGAVGLVLALPIEQALPLIEPLTDPVVELTGLALDRELGYLCLFLSPSALVAGSLLPGI